MSGRGQVGKDGLVRPPWLRPNRDGSPWYARTLRITTWRILSQGFFFALFLFLLWCTWFSRLGGYPVSLFLELDPLVGIATALSTHTVYRWLWRGLLILIPTLVLGRFFCNWICPYGTLHQVTSWIFRVRSNQASIQKNRYRALYQTKYLILAAMLVLAAFGSLQIGLLDPICLLVRSFTAALMPASDLATTNLAAALRERLGLDPEPLLLLAAKPGAAEARVFAGGWFIGVMLTGLVALNLVIPRFFCRVLCPLGALLGALSRFALWRIDRDVSKCTDCDACLTSCEGAADPQAALRKSECFVCMNCIDDCPEDALAFRLVPVPLGARVKDAISKLLETERASPAVPRRRWLFASIGGALAYPFLRSSAANDDGSFSPKLIRPPGSVAEPEFLERCIKCDQCINVCPTNVLQPASLAHAGVEGFWTPVMDFGVGFCQLNCTLCSEVCPTGAIQKIDLGAKLGLGDHAGAGPISLGTAFFDRGRCLPWAMETPCVVCEEVCPVSPKAIGVYSEEITRWDGQKVTLQKPYMRPELCIGCGICEHECPVSDQRAVYVTAIGETRSKERTLLLGSHKKREES